MTQPDARIPSATPAPVDPVVTLSEERLLVSTEWVESGRVRVRRRVTSETRSVQVTVRREELLIETDAAPSVDADGGEVDEPHPTHEPLVVVLREEVPQVTMSTRAYERVSVYVDMASTEHTVGEQVRREHADVTVESDPAGSDPAGSDAARSDAARSDSIGSDVRAAASE